LAAEIAKLLRADGLSVGIDDERGLDHGAWVPLRHLVPQANIPTLQIAIQPREGPVHHWRVGRALGRLREQGVLLLASGSMTHNLRALSFDAPEGQVTQAYARAFTDWMHDKLSTSALDELLDYRALAPDAVVAHPTDEHLLPLYIALGAAGERFAAERLHQGYTAGGLAMDAYAFN
jgi:4,5-DOPA dioxygenase extradiol